MTDMLSLKKGSNFLYIRLDVCLPSIKAIKKQRFVLADRDATQKIENVFH